MSTEDSMTDYLASHPRMIGALFTLMLVLSQAGSVAASAGTGTVGP